MEDHDHKQDDFYEALSRLTAIERDCVQHVDSEDNLLERLQYQREVALERLWSSFQAAASSLAQLYKERPSCDCCQRCLYNQNTNDNKPWVPFQGAANKVTHLYRDGSEGLRAGIELGYHAGYQKRNKDITTWVRKKRRNIKREEILLNLSGRSPPRRKFNDSKMNSLSVSPKPMSQSAELPPLPFTTGEFDFTAFMEGRNPFSDSGRKRHNDANMSSLDQSPHKRGRFL